MTGVVLRARLPHLLAALLAVSVLTIVTAAGDGSAPGPGFTCVPLGVSGGLVDGDLSAYLVAVGGTHNYVCLDAGTVIGGLRTAAAAGAFADLSPPSASPLRTAGLVLRRHVKAYLLSHAHFDHLAGLVISSPDDSAKPILALAPTIDALRDDVFNGRVWANFGDEGPAPVLGRYRYVRLTPERATDIAGTGLSVVALPLTHDGPTGSAAFLLEHRGQALLYLGDVGPDDPALTAVWRRVAPLIRHGSLAAVLLECSFPDPRDDGRLFGHLTPSRFMAELRTLAGLVDPEHPAAALDGLTVVVTHVKPSLEGEPAEAVVRRQLDAANDLGLRLILPRQGERLTLPAR